MTHPDLRSLFFRLTVLLCVLSGINDRCSAIDVPGYILHEQSDTVFGTIKLQRFDQTTGSLIINGFDFESLHGNVYFKGNGKKRYTAFSPDMISGFGFAYKLIDYTFKSFMLEYKSIFKNEQQKGRFLYLIYHGNIDLYKNNNSIYNPSGNFGNDNYLTSHEFFLYNRSKGLLKVEMNDQIKTFKDLLLKFDVDQRFIGEILENKKTDDLVAILTSYDQWLSNEALQKDR